MPFLPRFLLVFGLLTAPLPAQDPPLTRCVEVHALPREKAALGLPVAVRGVVTLAFAGKRHSFVVDDGRGVFVAWPEAAGVLGHEPETHGRERFETGMLVEVRGVTGRGRFAPIIVPEEIRTIGTAPLPPFHPMEVAAVRGGSMDCQCVELSGVVQRVAPSNPKNPERETQLEVVAMDGRFAVILREKGDFDLRALVDAEVRVRGVANTFFNARGESMGIRVQTLGQDSIAVTRPAPADPFSMPATTTRTLLPFSLDPPNLHRQRLQGTVTLCRPGEFFYLEDEGRAVRVHTTSPERLMPGQRVEVAGFAELVRGFAEVRNAVFRPLGTGPSPEARPTKVSELLAGLTRDSVSESDVLDGRLVQLRGRLLKVETAEQGGHRLVLDCEGRTVLATMDAEVPAMILRAFSTGSEVEVNGIAVLQLGAPWPSMVFSGARDFELLLRDAADVRVLRSPSWWTAERLWRLLGGTVAVLLGSLAWVTLLRRRVRLRSAQLAAEMQARSAAQIEHNATQRERTRLASDLHDTIEQALTGLAFQLDATRRFSPPMGERGAQHFELSRQILASSREDLRRAVWNLRAQGLEGQSFIDALRTSAERAVAGRGVEIAVEESGGPQAVPEFTAGHLLLLAQEAITNALKHANPTCIGVCVTHGMGEIMMAVEDDGAGFDPAQALGLADGHFGLQGMRERVDRLDGTLAIDSAPGRGTRIVVRVPTG